MGLKLRQQPKKWRAGIAERSFRRPYLQRLWVDDELDPKAGYPFSLPWLSSAFELELTTPITIVVGENGTRKSNLIEVIAAVSGYE